MPHPTEFLLRYGYVVLFLAVLTEQLGLPVPSAPFLLAAGALAGLGHLSLAEALALAVAASLIGDSIWFYLGKSRGASLLAFLCRISLEPDSCISSTRTAYLRYGPSSLLFAKFIPGLSTIAPPMAGMFKLKLWKFMVLDSIGTLVWAGGFAAVGWLFRNQLEFLGASLQQFGVGLGFLAALGLAAYIGTLYIKRQRVYRALRVARITPIELKQRMDSGESLIIVDLRNAVERQEGTIPGSIQLTDGNLDSHLVAIADAGVVLYCSCPDEFSSAKAAVRLKRLGIERVHPLEGGFALWHDLGFPVENAESPVVETLSLVQTQSDWLKLSSEPTQFPGRTLAR
ncbi:MAG: Rhodanese domain protein [Bryobacterales bacterium]|nr:Rhodanese domain protein [Bryobacterales bacterium]